MYDIGKFSLSGLLTNAFEDMVKELVKKEDALNYKPYFKYTTDLKQQKVPSLIIFRHLTIEEVRMVDSVSTKFILHEKVGSASIPTNSCALWK